MTKHAPVFLFSPPACPGTLLSFLTAVAKPMWPPSVKVLSATYRCKCYALVEEKKNEYSKAVNPDSCFYKLLL